MNSTNLKNQENKQVQFNDLASSPLIFFGGGLGAAAAGFFFHDTFAFLTLMVEIHVGN